MESVILIVFLGITVFLSILISVPVIYVYRKMPVEKAIKETNEEPVSISPKYHYLQHMLFIAGIFMAIIFMKRLDVFLQDSSAFIVLFIFPLYLFGVVRKVIRKKYLRLSLIAECFSSLYSGVL